MRTYVRTILGMANYPGHSNLTAIEIMRLKDAFQEYSSSKRREQIIKEVSAHELNSYFFELSGLLQRFSLVNGI